MAKDYFLHIFKLILEGFLLQIFTLNRKRIKEQEEK